MESQRFFTIHISDGSMVFDLYKASKKSAALSKMLVGSSVAPDDLEKETKPEPTWDMTCPVGTLTGLKIIHTWLEESHNLPPKEIDPLTRRSALTPADEKLTSLNREELNEIHSIASYLEIEEMIEALAEILLNQLQELPEKSSDSYRIFLGLPDDLTPKEKEEINKKNEWATQETPNVLRYH